MDFYTLTLTVGCRGGRLYRRPWRPMSENPWDPEGENGTHRRRDQRAGTCLWDLLRASDLRPWSLISMHYVLLSLRSQSRPSAWRPRTGGWFRPTRRCINRACTCAARERPTAATAGRGGSGRACWKRETEPASPPHQGSPRDHPRRCSWSDKDLSIDVWIYLSEHCCESVMKTSAYVNCVPTVKII